MARSLILLLFVTLAFCKVKHIVIIMEENRSFDHMLGWMKNLNPNIDGLTGKEWNRAQPFNASSPKYYSGTNAPYVAYFDPNHSLDGTTTEIFGALNHSGMAPEMVGFVNEAISDADKGLKYPPETIMQGFLPEKVPVITTMAQQGAIFDRMHAAIPGPTMPNRIFFLTCTSEGLVSNDVDRLAMGFTQKTIFGSAKKAGKNFGVYFHDVSEVIFLDEFRTLGGLERLHPIEEFADHVRDGSLPELVYINPRFYAELEDAASDQHPVHDVRMGEKLLKHVYDTLRQSAIWNETAIIVTYDEHGGYFDHVPTPVDGVPNPDGKDSKTTPPFKFDRLGVRIPFVVVSPLVDANTVVHDPPPAQKPTPTSAYDHSSVHATIMKHWGIEKFLTKRDEWAGTFEHIFNEEARSDMPWEMPEVEGLDMVTTALRELQMKPTGLQLELADRLGALLGHSLPAFENVDEAADWVEEKMKELFHRHKVTYPKKPRRGLGKF